MQIRARTRLFAARGRTKLRNWGRVRLGNLNSREGRARSELGIALDGHQYPKFLICSGCLVGSRALEFSPPLTLPLPLVLPRFLFKDVVIWTYEIKG